jgi:hypothetical protein
MHAIESESLFLAKVKTAMLTEAHDNDRIASLWLAYIRMLFSYTNYILYIVRWQNDYD